MRPHRGMRAPLRVVVAVEGWQLISQPRDLWIHILIATLGGALALLGTRRVVG